MPGNSTWEVSEENLELQLILQKHVEVLKIPDGGVATREQCIRFTVFLGCFLLRMFEDLPFPVRMMNETNQDNT